MTAKPVKSWRPPEHEWIPVLYKHSDEYWRRWREFRKNYKVTIRIVRDVAGLHHWYAEIDGRSIDYGGPYERAYSAQVSALHLYPMWIVDRIIKPDRKKG